MATFTFDKLNRLITVDAPTTEVTIQELINAIRDWEDEPVNMEVASLALASGKEDLGGGLAVGITLKLLNWKLKFEDRAGPDTVLCDVSGGNLVAVDENDVAVNPIEPAAYVTVTKTSSVAAGLIAEWTQTEKDKILSDVDTIEVKTANLPADPASESSLTTHDADIKGPTWTDESLKSINEALGRSAVAPPKSIASQKEKELNP